MSAARRLTVVVCSGPVCRDQRGSAELRRHLDEVVAARGLGGQVSVVDEVCLGHCLRGPNVLVAEDNDDSEGAPPFDPRLGTAAPRTVLYNRMTVEDLDRVVERHLVGGMAVRPLMNRPPFRSGGGGGASGGGASGRGGAGGGGAAG